MIDSEQIVYQKQKRFYKYVVRKELYKRTRIPLKNRGYYANEFFSITGNGDLTLKKFYRWDGASGPTKDDGSNQRGSAIHDALYQCIRLGIIDIKYRKKIDKLFHKILLEDRMNRFRAGYYYGGVRWKGAGVRQRLLRRPRLHRARRRIPGSGHSPHPDAQRSFQSRLIETVSRQLFSDR